MPLDDGIRELALRLRSEPRVTVVTGAGVSAASGIPTFRGPGGLWRNFRPQDLATPEAFARDPLLVWEWYAWRRELVARARPNRAHEVLAAWSQRLPAFTLITQNVDGLHERAGTRGVTCYHGSLWELRCWEGCASASDACSETVGAGLGCRRPSDDASYCRGHAVGGRTAPARLDRAAARAAPTKDGGVRGCAWRDESAKFPELPPRCPHCGGLARPGVVWFGEPIPHPALRAASRATECDLFLTVGTSSVVYPAASLAEAAASRGAFTVEINPEATPASSAVDLVLPAPAEEVLDRVESLLLSPPPA